MKRLPNILFSYLHHYWPLMVIIFVETVLFITNYKPQTFLIGWDNLYPELNPILNIQRSFLAVWQEYRNLGYLDGMSQAANLFQDIFRYVLSLVFPTSLVRWIIVFLLHLIGGIGMYILMEYYILQRITQKNISKLIALFGALFYQYNFITVQQFFLPFELFLFHYAFIPLLTYFALVFIDTGKKKHLVWFSLASFLSIPQAHVPTIFIVYILLLSLLMLTKVILSKGKNVKRILLLCLVTFTINCYWGLPFLYGTIQNASIIAHSKNNEMATYDIFYRNLKFGQFHDVATLKGIILDYWQYNVQLNKSGYMMQPWRSYLQSYWFIIPSWIFFLITSCGLVLTIIKRKVIFFPFVTLFIFSFTMMANDTPVLSFFFMAIPNIRTSF